MARLQQAQGRKEAHAFGLTDQIVPGCYHGAELESKTGDMWGASPVWQISQQLSTISKKAANWPAALNIN